MAICVNVWYEDPNVPLAFGWQMDVTIRNQNYKKYYPEILHDVKQVCMGLNFFFFCHSITACALLLAHLNVNVRNIFQSLN